MRLLNIILALAQASDQDRREIVRKRQNKFSCSYSGRFPWFEMKVCACHNVGTGEKTYGPYMLFKYPHETWESKLFAPIICATAQFAFNGHYNYETVPKRSLPTARMLQDIGYR